MRLSTLTLLLCLLSPAPACDAQNAKAPAPTPAPASAQAPQGKTCALLSAEELREVQGEAPVSVQGSEHAAGPLSMSRCFFRLPTFSKSVNLEVVRAAPGAPAGALKEYWDRRFGPGAGEAREEETKKGREAGRAGEGGRGRERGEGEESPRPQPVPGLGQEAYLTGNDINTTLFVLGGDAVLRLSIGGPEGRADKLKKAAALAGRALKRL